MFLHPHKQHLSSIVSLALLATLTFFAGLHSPFLYDDLHAIVDNPYIKDLSQFQTLIGIENIFNRSVLQFTFAINHHIGGQSVFGYHLVNTLLHLFSAIVFYFIALELIQLERDENRTRLKNLPLFAAALHTVNPVAVEPVLYISSRSSLLASFFYLLTFYTILFYFKKKPKNPLTKTGYFLTILLFFLLGLGSKEIVLTLPLIAGSYLWLKTPTEDRRKIFAPLFIAAAFLGGYLVLRYVRQGAIFTATADPASAELNRWLYFFTQIKIWIFYYLNKLLFPINLNFEPDIVLAENFSDPACIASIFIAFGLTAVFYFQHSRLAKFAAIWTLLTILPTSSIVPLKQIAVEHRTYLSGFGVSLLLAWAILSVLPKVQWRVVTVTILLALFSSLMIVRTLDYRTRIILWEDTALKSPQKPLVHNNLATAYLADDQFDRAKAELETLVKIDPLYANAYINLGNILLRQKKPDEALPYFDHALELGSERAEVFYNAGLARLQTGRTQEAIPFLTKAVGMKPNHEGYRFQLGNAYREIKNYDSALLQYRILTRRNPKHVEARNNAGVIFWNLKNYSLAEKEFLKAFKEDDKYPEVLGNLVSLYLVTGRPEEAISYLKRLAEIQPNSPRVAELMMLYQQMQNRPTGKQPANTQ
ncbi:MAG: hypothetical protein COV66_00145 [Nitrospinae bacterium CG11_big_fil_rev_8_21_14_0_20_45_15]|nr:MAG: hypothetical protein COV66_00145 [Nitrospinae bacterium CG11_big_fil_rev_8_21_14_0_20_45_15]